MLLTAETADTIRAAHGADGDRWVDVTLPAAIRELSARWQLDVAAPMPGGRSSCVLACTTRHGDAAVLKVAPPWHGSAREAATLQAFGAASAPAVLAHDPDLGGLLMERVVTGQLLSAATPPGQVLELAHRMHPPAGPDLPALDVEVGRRLRSRAKHVRTPADAALLDEAADVADQLLSQCGPTVTLHGDLYAGKNVLACDDRLSAVIDPFGCVGPPESDLAMWSVTCRDTHPDIHLGALAAAFASSGYDLARLYGWMFVLAASQKLGSSPQRADVRDATLAAARRLHDDLLA